MPWIILGITVSYFIGSVPTAYIFGRLLKGIDIRKFGSGNVGATNAFRVLGRGPGISVLILDIFKGFFAIAFLSNFIASRAAGISKEWLGIILGLSCIAGHNWTIFLKFKGGKGVATTFGVLFGLAASSAGLRPILILAILTWAFTFVIMRRVSLASILTALALPVYMIIFKQSRLLIFSGSVLCILIILRHKSNLKRLLQNKEPRLF
jgi:glycerol-3-phosphate acyltransferase PlsY